MATEPMAGLKALERDRNFGRNFLLEFQDKLLFGRDYFDARLMDFLRDLALPAEAFDKLAYQNAERLLSSYMDEPQLAAHAGAGS